MKVEKENKETGKIEIHEEWKYISAGVCKNFDLLYDNDVYTTLIELKWWGTFPALKQDEEYEKAVSWAKENSEGLFYCSRYDGRFEFELESDVMAFKLCWS